jgi:hypothetical protein
MEQITQTRFSESVRKFEKDFCELWNMTGYVDVDAPCFFAGVYNKHDVEVIKKHRGLRIVWFCGGDRFEAHNFAGHDIIVLWMDYIEAYLPPGIKTKKAFFPIKDSSMLTPGRLGDKMYMYIRELDAKHKAFFNYDLSQRVSEKSGFDILYGIYRYNIHEVKKIFYDNCFINLQFVPEAGRTTSRDLALMGRHSISNWNSEHCLPYKGIDDILRHIERQSKKIGSIQSSLLGDIYDTGEEWKNVNFWI